MSTDVVIPPRKEKKQRKSKEKDKHSSTTKSPKKRHREAQPSTAGEEELDRIPDSQPTKKHKSNASAQQMSTPTSQSEDQLIRHSPFVQQTTSLYLPLSACAFRAPLEGLCAEHLSPLLLTWSAQLRGVMLSYANARISEHAEGGIRRQRRRRKEQTSDGEQENSEDDTEEIVLARSVDEYGVAFAWLTADFLLFRPRRGTYLEGFVNLQNESMLGLICYNYFNAGIEREKLPPDWRWVEETDEENQGAGGGEGTGEGHYMDGSGKKIEGRVVFQVEDFEATAESDASVGIVSIIGTLLPQNGKS